MQVERVDAEWIHGRGRDRRQKELSVKKVLLFGSGSVGTPIGDQLAMAGLGHIIPVDPANLSWANVGRHPLGADHVAVSFFVVKGFGDMLSPEMPGLTLACAILYQSILVLVDSFLFFEA